MSELEPRPAVRLAADSRPVVVLATWLVGLLAAAAFVMGVPGLLVVAEWVQLEGWMRYLLPVVLDLGLVIAALAAIIARARRESAAIPYALLIGLTSLSVGSQVAHIVVPATAVVATVVIGAVVAPVAPLTVLLSTELLMTLAIAPPVRRGRSARASRQSTAPAMATAKGVAPTKALVLPVAEDTGSGAAPSVGLARPHRLTPEQEARIVSLRGDGMSLERIAAEVGCGKGSVGRVLKRAAADELAAA